LIVESPQYYLVENRYIGEGKRVVLRSLNM
jgi:hypothetical protein